MQAYVSSEPIEMYAKPSTAVDVESPIWILTDKLFNCTMKLNLSMLGTAVLSWIATLSMYHKLEMMLKVSSIKTLLSICNLYTVQTHLILYRDRNVFKGQKCLWKFWGYFCLWLLLSLWNYKYGDFMHHQLILVHINGYAIISLRFMNACSCLANN